MTTRVFFFVFFFLLDRELFHDECSSAKKRVREGVT